MRIPVIFFLSLISLFVSGCGGRYSPLDSGFKPEQLKPVAVTESSYAKSLWGLYDIAIDRESGSVCVIPLRSEMFTVNPTKFLQPPFSLSSKLLITLDSETDLPNGYIVADVSITHPFPNSNLMGFDVIGIFMPPSGEYMGKHDTSLTWPSFSQARLLNADGYTRWWNQAEFTSANSIFGYTEGSKAPKGFNSNCKLNPFKYFAYGIGVDDPFNPDTLGLTNRGSFPTTAPSAGPRRYKIQFPPSKGIDFRFKYAISANWEPPPPGTVPPAGIDDFSFSSNQQEAVQVYVMDNGTDAYYTPTTTGGDLRFKVSVTDWQGGMGPSIVNGSSGIFIESPTLFPGEINILQSGEWWLGPGPNTLNMMVIVPNVSPTTTTGQDILVTVVSAGPTGYAPPFPGYEYPVDASLAAYQVWTAPIKDSQ